MNKLLALSIALLLGACASTPNVNYSYFPATSRTTVSVTQTVDCTADKTAFVVSYGAPQVTTVDYADTSKGPYTLPVKKLDSALADSDFSFNLTDDGRLKSINAAWTGQAQTILQSAISLGEAAFPMLGSSPGGPPKAMPECAFLKNWNGGKPATIVYSGLLNLASDDNIDLTHAQDDSSTKLFAGLDGNRKLPHLGVHVLERAEIPNPASYAGAPGDYDVWLTLTRTENVKFSVETNGTTIFSSSVVVPGTSTYKLPVPGAALFGRQSFALTLTDAGAISSIDYGKLTGAAGPLNVLNSAASAIAP